MLNLFIKKAKKKNIERKRKREAYVGECVTANVRSCSFSREKKNYIFFSARPCISLLVFATNGAWLPFVSDTFDTNGEQCALQKTEKGCLIFH